VKELAKVTVRAWQAKGIVVICAFFLCLGAASNTAAAEPGCESAASGTRNHQIEQLRSGQRQMEKILARLKGAEDSPRGDCSMHYGISGMTGGYLGRDPAAAARSFLDRFELGEEIPGGDFYGPGLCFMGYRKPSMSEEESLTALFALGLPGQQTFLAKRKSLVLLKKTQIPNALDYCEPKLLDELEDMRRLARNAEKNGFKSWIDEQGRYHRRIPSGKEMAMAHYPDNWTPLWVRVRRNPATGDLMVLQMLGSRIAVCGFPASSVSSSSSSERL
jgi:hypothetical protein